MTCSVILKRTKKCLGQTIPNLLSYDDVELEFDDLALQEIATQSHRTQTVRVVCSIIEETMLDVMFEVPSQENVKLVRITKEAVDGTENQLRNSLGGDYGNLIHTTQKSCSVRPINPTIRSDDSPEIALQGRSNVAAQPYRVPCSIARPCSYIWETWKNPAAQLFNIDDKMRFVDVPGKATRVSKRKVGPYD